MLIEQLQKDIIAAMKAKDEHLLTTLRMAKAAIQNKEKERQTPLTDLEAEAVLTTLIKQRRDSFEQFTKGGREDLALKEEAEVKMLEEYLPQEASEAELSVMVNSFITGLCASGQTVSPKLMGSVIKGVKELLATNNLRADGKLLSTVVQSALKP